MCGEDEVYVVRSFAVPIFLMENTAGLNMNRRTTAGPPSSVSGGRRKATTDSSLEEADRDGRKGEAKRDQGETPQMKWKRSREQQRWVNPNVKDYPRCTPPW